MSGKTERYCKQCGCVMLSDKPTAAEFCSAHCVSVWRVTEDLAGQHKKITKLEATVAKYRKALEFILNMENSAAYGSVEDAMQNEAENALAKHSKEGETNV